MTPSGGSVATLAPGAWLFTCRAGLEADLVEELTVEDARCGARALEPALVVSRRPPKITAARVDVTFAWQCFEVTAVVAERRGGVVAERREGVVAERREGVVAERREAEGRGAIARAVIAAAPRDRAWGLHTWVPDAPLANPHAGAAAALHAALGELASAEAPELAARRVPAEALAREDGVLVQVCLTSGAAAIGRIDARTAPSLFPGGRERMHVPGAPPARSAAKLAAALAWLGVAPEPGELCVDLGAAPGGWTHVLLDRRARVIAVDPARMSPALAGRRGLTHVQASAFDWAPDEPVDWLFCDMAWRPLEVAALLAKWGRRKWARVVVANVKLPMKRKVEMLARVREILASGGLSDIRTRHLYHDRDEITLTAWRR